MVGHFLQTNRRNRSLSQPNNTSSGDMIGETSTDSRRNNNGNYIASYATDSNNATIDLAAAKNPSYGYNLNGTRSSASSDNCSNINGISHHQKSALASSMKYAITNETTLNTSSSMKLTPTQNLTAEVVAALPPPGS